MSGAPRRVAAAPGRQSAYQIEKGLKQSLESVDNGLKRFLLSLQESGMTEGIQGYRAMQMVLVQQRLWAHSHSRAQLVPLFKSIAKTANELHRIFAGYAEVMKPLRDLDKITRVSAGGAAPAAGEERAVEPQRPAAATDEPEGLGDAAPAGPCVEGTMIEGLDPMAEARREEDES